MKTKFGISKNVFVLGLVNFLMIWLWRCSKDWKGKISDKIFEEIKPDSILLFHDCLQTSLILPKILERFKKEGYALNNYSNIK